MKRLFRVTAYLVIAFIVAVAILIGYWQWRGIPKYPVKPITFPAVTPDSAMIANGGKIAAVQCMVCHRGADGKLSGRLLQELPPEFGEIHSANITQSKAHGIGTWTDAQLAYLLRTGVKPNGDFLPVYMPKFPHLSDYDLKSVIAFLRSSQPVVQPSEIAAVKSKPSLLTKILCNTTFKEIPYPNAPIPEPDTNNAIAFGRYLVTGRYDCYTCHSADFKTLNMAAPEQTPGYCGGGNTMITLTGATRLTANITFDEKTGIGLWNIDDFTNAMLHAKRKDGHVLREPMLTYNGMTEKEIQAIWAYLKSIPKITHEVPRNWEVE
ncbi:MAG: c-type cytochrome [Chitinophagales bacterium]